MRNLRTVALLIIGAHWIVAIVHLFLAARVLPPPNDHVGGIAVLLISAGHLIVSVVLWKLSERVAGVITTLFFLSALIADVYEHFVHASLNNVFMVRPGNWTGAFDVSVLALAALEIIGCLAGILLAGGWTPRPRHRDLVIE